MPARVLIILLYSFYILGVPTPSPALDYLGVSTPRPKPQAGLKLSAQMCRRNGSRKFDSHHGKAERKAAGRVVSSPDGGPQKQDRIRQFSNGWPDMILQGRKMAKVRGTPATQGGTWLGKEGRDCRMGRHMQDPSPDDQAGPQKHRTAAEGARSRPYPVQEDPPVPVRIVHAVRAFRYTVKRGPVTWAKYSKA